MRYKIIATILIMILMLTNVLPILASQDDATDSYAIETIDVGDTADEANGGPEGAGTDGNSEESTIEDGSKGDDFSETDENTNGSTSTGGDFEDSVDYADTDESSDESGDTGADTEGKTESDDEGDDADKKDDTDEESGDTDDEQPVGDDSEDENTDTEKDSDVSDDESFDITPPVINSVTVIEQGQSVQAGDTVTIMIDAYDAGVGISYFDIYCYHHERLISSSYMYTAEDVETAPRQYVINIPTGTLNGRYDLVISVYDKKGNFAWKGGSEGTSYWFDVVGGSDTVDITGVSITKGGNPLSITDVLRPGDTVHVTVTIAATENISEGWIEFAPNYEDGFFGMGIPLIPSANGTDIGTKLEGELRIDTSTHPGKYAVAFVRALNKNNIVSELHGPSYGSVFGGGSELLTNLGFTVINDDYGDIEAPCVSNISLDKQGQIVRAGDTVTVSVTVKDESEITQMIVSFFILGLPDVKDFTMEQVGDSDVYQAVLEITEDTYPSEWALDYWSVVDSFGNFADNSYDENGNYLSDLYYVQVYNGSTFVNPTYNVTLYSQNEVGELISKTIKVPRRTKLEELNSMYPPVTIPGLQFVGWNAETAEQAAVINQYGITRDGYVFYAEYTSDCNSISDDSSDTWSSDSAQNTWDNSQSQTTTPKTATGGRTNTGSTGTNNTVDSQKPSEADNSLENPSDMTENRLLDEWTAGIVAQIKQAASGNTVIVDMGNATVVYKEILEAAQGRDVNIILQMSGYTWTINGRNILSPSLRDIDLMVIPDTTNIPNNTIKELAGDNPVKQISLVHEGNFGFLATLTINIGSQYANMRGRLYYYDSSGRMVFIDGGDIGEDGNVSLTFSHASDYL